MKEKFIALLTIIENLKCDFFKFELYIKTQREHRTCSLFNYHLITV